MRHITICLLCLTIAAAGSSFCLAQNKRLCPVPPPSPFKHSAQIVTSFDPSADRMRTTLEHPRVLGKEGAGVYLSATFLHHDTRRPAPAIVDIIFISSSPEFKFRQTHDLVIICDGKRAPVIGAARYRSQTNAQGAALEATSITLSYDELRNMTRARKVIARIGQSEFELTNNHLESLRELASLMMPPPSRWRAED